MPAPGTTSAAAPSSAASGPASGSPHAPSAARPHRRSILRRALLAISAVAAAEIIGTVGFHAIQGFDWVNSVYFESMLATGQGPPLTLTTDSAKVFASVMAFVSVGSSLSAVLFVLGPLLNRIWRVFVERVEHEVRTVEREIRDDLR